MVGSSGRGSIGGDSDCCSGAGGEGGGEGGDGGGGC